MGFHSLQPATVDNISLQNQQLAKCSRWISALCECYSGFLSPQMAFASLRCFGSSAYCTRRYKRETKYSRSKLLSQSIENQYFWSQTITRTTAFWHVSLVRFKLMLAPNSNKNTYLIFFSYKFHRSFSHLQLKSDISYIPAQQRLNQGMSCTKSYPQKLPS